MSTIDVEKVLGSLSVQEKIALVAAKDFWHTADLPKHGVPSIRVSDGPNGIRGTKVFDGVPAACFPNGTCLASTFNSELLEEAGELMREEAQHKGANVILGPTTNIQRGPLGGRGFESFSEDPYLSGIASASIIRGIQKSGEVAATLKHFVCNDLEHERNSSDSSVTERALREIYLEPFRIAIREAGPQCIMSSYNKVNGTHCSEHHHLVQEVLRDEWSWDGLLMSDWLGVYSTVGALKEGVDIEFPGPPIFRTQELVRSALNSKEGGLDEDDLDERARRVLNLAKWVVEGNGTTKLNTKEDALNNTAETSKKLRGLAAEGIVLLKNDKGVLPLSKSSSTVVIGPNGDALETISGGGSAAMLPYYVVTPLQGIQNKLGHDVDYTPGCDSYKHLAGLFEKMTNDLGEENGAKCSFYLKPPEERTPEDKPYDVKLIRQSVTMLYDYEDPAVDSTTHLFWADFDGQYTPTESATYEFGCQVSGTALVYLDGKLLIDNKTSQAAGVFCYDTGTTEVTATAELKAGQSYSVKVEFGSGPTSSVAREPTPGGLQVGVTKIFDADTEIKHAAELAKAHDNVILCIGLTGEWESEGYDRDSMALPRRTDDLVRAVLKANPSTVVVNQSGNPVELPWLEHCSTLVQAYYGGIEMGNALADVLFGDIVPSGKLSMSWPVKNQDNPAFLNFSTQDGRVLYGEDIFVGYRYYEKLERRVAFPFGHGLSYTTFKYDDLAVSTDGATELHISFKLTNVGKVAGKEAVQVYISQTSPSQTRPPKELKAFSKHLLGPGESTTVKFSLDLKHACSYFREYKGKWMLEAGNYKVLVGSSSSDIRLTGDFDVKKTLFWKGL